MSKQLRSARSGSRGRRERGISLASVLAGLAILGILAAITVPSYASYTRRVYVGEGLELAMPAKAAAAEYYELEKASSRRNDVMTRMLPTETLDADPPPAIQPEVIASQPSRRVEAVLRAGSLVAVSYAQSLDPEGRNNYYLVLKPSSRSGATVWACLSGARAGTAMRGVDMGNRLPMPEELAGTACP